jgi:hypothetical protein
VRGGTPSPAQPHLVMRATQAQRGCVHAVDAHEAFFFFRLAISPANT